MSDSKTSPVQVDFYIRDAVEIAYLMRELLRLQAPLSLILAEGQAYQASMVLAVDTALRQLVLDTSGPGQGAPIPRAARALAAAAPGGVPLRFALTDFERVVFEGRPAYRVPFPDELERLQRREAYRQRTPERPRVSCEIRLPDGRPLGLQVEDLSVGGLRGSAGAPEPLLVPGLKLPAARLLLPGEKDLEITMTVRVAHPASGPAGRPAWGLSFEGLRAGQEAAIQRCLIQYQRAAQGGG
jgi:flagellar brake protein